MMKPFILGIFGPPGSGKTTVSGLLQKHGYQIWNADQEVSDLYKPGGDGAKRIGEYFGKTYLDVSGGVLKSKLAKMVLSRPGKFQILEHMIHPLVINGAQQWIDTQKRVGHDRLALESAVFESAGLGRFCDVLLRVTADREPCLARVLARGKSAEYFRLMSGYSRDYETPYEMVNNGSFEELEKAFEKVLAQITMASEKKLSS